MLYYVISFRMCLTFGLKRFVEGKNVEWYNEKNIAIEGTEINYGI